jgi:hypothetical protein
MNLRATLKAAVARCAPLPMQHATFQESHAKGIATTVQQVSAIPHEIRVHAATAIATAMQQESKTSATPSAPDQKLHVALTRPCNLQQGSLTAHRLTKDLLRAAMNVCDQHVDQESARAEMRQQCMELPPHLQKDLLDHFLGKSRIFPGDEQ